MGNCSSLQTLLAVGHRDHKGLRVKSDSKGRQETMELQVQRERQDQRERLGQQEQRVARGRRE